MAWNPFSAVSKNFLGIDIGTNSMKIIELSQRGDRIKLENYGEASALTLYEKPFRTIDKNTLHLSSHEIAKALLAIFEEAKISERRAIFSIPDFATFFIDFSLPPMTREEVPEAGKYEAKQYIPMPLSEVILDWQIVEGEMGRGKNKGTSLKVLLVVVPIEFVNQYQEIANLAGLKLQAVEAEAFSLLRSLVGKDKRSVCVIDMGAQSTTVNIADKGILKKSHSFDISGNEFTKVISESLRITMQEAEKLKKDKGMSQGDLSPRKILIPLMDHIARETENIFRTFSQLEGKNVEKIILAGSSVQMPELREYFSETFKREVEIADPFANIFYPPILEKKIKSMGPAYSIAVGNALRGLEL